MSESIRRDGELRAGAILAGKYRVDRVLGEGGMGVVLAAHHLHLDERVAIKTLLPEMLQHSDAVARFLREARAAVKIKSEHVARVSDVGTLDNGAPYMVMEYLEGEDLAQRVASQGPLAIEQAVEFILQASEALAEAHAAGIVHRDLKPANLFCVRRADGLLSIKVLDFGISKMGVLGGSGVDMGMTKTTAVMGSPYYMSPEQMLSAKNADAQSDIWSMGAVLFELLSGRVPFPAETLPELVLKVSNTPAPDVRQLRPEVPEGLRAVVARALQRDKAQRYLSVAELALDLCEFGPAKRARASAERIVRVLESAGQSTSRRARSLGSDAPALPKVIGAGTLAPLGQTAPWTNKPRRGAFYAAAIAALLAVGGFAIFVILNKGTDEAPQALVANPLPGPKPPQPEPKPPEPKPPEPEVVPATPALELPAPPSPATHSSAPPKVVKAPKPGAKPAPTSAAATTPPPAASAAPVPKPKPSFGGRL